MPVVKDVTERIRQIQRQGGATKKSRYNEKYGRIRISWLRRYLRYRWKRTDDIKIIVKFRSGMKKGGIVTGQMRTEGAEEEKI